MSNILSNESTGKKWYQKPENLTGAIVITIIGVIGMKYGAQLLSGIMNLAGFLGVAAVITIILATLITQWRTIGSVWQVLMYKLTNAIYSIDPIAIAWTKIDKLKERKEKVNSGLVKIKGALYNVTSQLQKNEQTIEENNTRILALEKMGNKDLEIKLLAQDNVRLEPWNEDLKKLQATMTNMQNGLTKLFEAADFVIRDKTRELQMLESRYNSVKIGWKAVSEAQGIYGSSKDRADLEQLIGLADNDMNEKLADMDRFMELAAPVFMQVDIEKNINDVKVQEMIKKVKKGDLDKMLSNITSPTGTKKVNQGVPDQNISGQKIAAGNSKYNLED